MTDIRDEVAAALQVAAVMRQVDTVYPAVDALLAALAARGLTVVREGQLEAALPDALSLATEQDTSYAYSDEPGSPYVRFLAAALYARLTRQPEEQ